ncbi:unannotated protein [freshwater metagenome]|uniref:Unannotated protein n=1 Tax=freshwater metagenome TaxID=449393 RepID=A0A6J6G797_9ZZZZ
MQPAISPAVMARPNSMASSIDPVNPNPVLCSPPMMNGVESAGLIDALLETCRATSTPSTKIAIDPGSHDAAT